MLGFIWCGCENKKVDQSVIIFYNQSQKETTGHEINSPCFTFEAILTSRTVPTPFEMVTFLQDSRTRSSSSSCAKLQHVAIKVFYSSTLSMPFPTFCYVFFNYPHTQRPPTQTRSSPHLLLLPHHTHLRLYILTHIPIPTIMPETVIVV